MTQKTKPTNRKTLRGRQLWSTQPQLRGSRDRRAWWGGWQQLSAFSPGGPCWPCVSWPQVAAGALQHHTGRQACSTKPGLARPLGTMQLGLGTRPAWSTEDRWSPGEEKGQAGSLVLIPAACGSPGAVSLMALSPRVRENGQYPHGG